MRAIAALPPLRLALAPFLALSASLVPACAPSPSVATGEGEGEVIAGATRIADLRTTSSPSPRFRSVSNMVELGGRALFFADYDTSFYKERSEELRGLPSSDTGLFASDGTDAGTVLLRGELGPRWEERLGGWTVLGTRAYVWRHGPLGAELLSTDGTAANTSVVITSPVGVAHKPPSPVVVGGAVIVLVPSSVPSELKLFRLDPSGPVELATVPAPLSLNVRLVSDGNVAFAVGQNGVVVRTQGTPASTVASTVAEKDLNDVAVRAGRLFFVRSVSNGWELLEIGNAGAALVKRMAFGKSQINNRVEAFDRLQVVGDRLWISSTNGELWTSDGTTNGTVHLLDAPSNYWDAPRSFFPFAGKVLLVSDTGIVWSSDGTQSGTVEVRPSSVAPGERVFSSRLRGMSQAANGTLVWLESDYPERTLVLWDPSTNSGSTLTLDDKDDGAEGVLISSGAVVVGNAKWGLSFVDVAGSTTTSLSPLPAAASSSPRGLSSRRSRGLPVANGRAFFTADDGVHGRELWSTNGTAAGTVLVGDLSPGDTDTRFLADSFVTIGNRGVFWIEDDVQGGQTLYGTDGTVGSAVVLGRRPTAEWYGSERILGEASGATSDRYYFTARAADGSTSLHVTDGTTAGTHALATWNGVSKVDWVTELAPNVALISVAPPGTHVPSKILKVDHQGGVTTVLDSAWESRLLGSVGGATIVGASPTASKLEENVFTLYAVTGSGAQPLSTTALRSASHDPNPSSWVVGSNFFFEDANGLTRTDGTTGGTLSLFSYDTSKMRAELLGEGSPGHALFRTPEHIVESDGTAAGTVVRAPAGPPLGVPYAWLPGKGGFFATGVSVPNGRGGGCCPTQFNEQLAYFDVTTAQVTSLLPTPDVRMVSSVASPLVDGTLLFVASTLSTGSEVWKSDGTIAGTKLVGEVASGYPSSTPDWMTPLGKKVIFAATDANGDRELWSAPTKSFQ